MIEHVKNYQEYLDYLISLGDEKFKKFSSKLMNSKYPSIGINIPTLKKIAKELLSKDICLKKENYLYFEELLIYGLTIKYQKNTDKIIDNYNFYADKIDSWAHVDTVVSSLKQIKSDRKFYLNFIENLLSSNNEFIKRSGFVFLLCYYLDSEYEDYVLDKVIKDDSNLYYVQMAKAWLVSVAYVKFSDKNKIIKFLENCKDKFLVNKTISKICDSYRVSKKEKEEIKKLRR